MKQRVLIKGVVSSVAFPNRGKLVPAKVQCSPKEAVPPAGIFYVAADQLPSVIHVKNLLPGQTWLVSTHKSGRYRDAGTPVKLVSRAPYETEPSCPHAQDCGGCLYQTVPYEIQLEWKQQQMKDLLLVVPQVEEAEFLPIVPSPSPLCYRNKLEFTFGDSVKGGPLTLGMHKRNAYHDILNTPDCRLVSPDMQQVAEFTASFFRRLAVSHYNTYTHEGYLRNLVVRSSLASGEVMVNLVTASSSEESALSDAKRLESWAQGLRALPLPGHLSGILHTTCDAVADVVRADQMEVLDGVPYLTESLLGLQFEISPFSFFQTNTAGAERLYQIVRSFAGDVSGKEVFDLYCGTGTIAQVMASAGAAHVTGIELVEEAVEAARKNASRNGLSNCDFIAGDVLQQVDTLNVRPNLIVLDPPRDGIHPKAMPKILSFQPDEFIYVSCKPTSLVRDLPLMEEAGYVPVKFQCCDMFPQTPNVEVVCQLVKRGSSGENTVRQKAGSE